MRFTQWLSLSALLFVWAGGIVPSVAEAEFTPLEPENWVPASSLPLAPHDYPMPLTLMDVIEYYPQSPVFNPLIPEHASLSPLQLEAKRQKTVKVLLGYSIPAGVATRMTWVPSQSFSGLDVNTPVLVVNGKQPGKTLCLTAAVHGDELNGIEMVRQVMYGLNPSALRGTVIGVPIVNLMAFGRSSRYLPDRRDLNRYFPGNPYGSLASRFAYAFFNDIVRHCDALVDLHTGSFHRTNLMQVRADLSTPSVAELTSGFGKIVALNTQGNPSSLRAAAVAAGIPAVTMEAGEPLRLQKEVVLDGVEALRTLLKKRGMIDHSVFWREPDPAIYQSSWVRTPNSGILFSQVKLGARVKKGEILGTVTNPVTSERFVIKSPYNGTVIGMALDQFVLPGFASYHIGLLSNADTPVQPTLDSDGFEDE
ncbi:MAG TPA: succinylglutamate desuccinylase/aspartoacylase family protein [Marinagarivorans sp.]